MIYNVHDSASFQPLENYEPPEMQTKDKILSQITYGCVSALLFPVKLVFNLLAFFSEQEDEESGSRESPFTQHEDGRLTYSSLTMEIEAMYHAEVAWLELKMNHGAFARFVQAIANIYPTRSSMSNAPQMVALNGRTNVDQEGYHLHSELFFPELPFEITIGTGKGSFMIEAGDWIIASPQTWRKAIKLWREILQERDSRIIVLDRFQDGWCEPDCKGRFSIEYEQHFVTG